MRGDEGGGDAALVLREAVDGGALEAVRGDEGAVALVLDFCEVEARDDSELAQLFDVSLDNGIFILI